jgi:hypothetical protein
MDIYQEIRAKRNICRECKEVNLSHHSRCKSDFYEALDISNMPVNHILDLPSDISHTPRSESGTDLNESLSRSSQDSPRLGNLDCTKRISFFEEEIQHCFSNLNCITSIDPKFAIDIDKFSNKRNKLENISSSIFLSMMDLDVEGAEVPEDFYEDVI